jgi:Xaa-Pro dipeptidase
MTRDDRLAAVRHLMVANGIDTLLAATGGMHLIDGFDPVAHLTGFRAIGPAILVLTATTARLYATPASDAERMAHAVAWADPVAQDAPTPPRLSGRIGWVGRDLLPFRLATAWPEGTTLDRPFLATTARKTEDEIAAARLATAIAESGLQTMMELARPGLPECDLAVAVNLAMRAQGANDSFLMLNAGPRAPAVMPSSERKLERGDIVLTELSPSVDGQFVQICRTLMLGNMPALTEEKYNLLCAALDRGIAAVKPGNRVADVCAAINDFLGEAGYAQYSSPPYIRRRGHGLGCGSIFPGDVAMDNDTMLEPDMVFVVHPNQFLPETGYMMCGEPVLVTETGVEVLSRSRARLIGIPLS